MEISADIHNAEKVRLAVPPTFPSFVRIPFVYRIFKCTTFNVSYVPTNDPFFSIR